MNPFTPDLSKGFVEYPMAQLTFYQQQRADGGLRTGIDLDGQTLAECYVSGTEEADPALKWYIDLRYQGAELPTDADAARAWFQSREGECVSTLRQVAAELDTGLDHDALPYRKAFSSDKPDVKLEVAASAQNRITALQVAEHFRNLAVNWRANLESLVENLQV
jgi:hypothetical protein